MKRLCILGESPLLEEYASLLLNKGYAVQGRANPGDRGVIPQGMKKVPKPVRTVDAALELTNTDSEQKRLNLRELDRVLSPATPILTSSVTVSLSEQATWVRTPDRLVGIGALPSFLEGALVELCTLERTTEKTVAAASMLLQGMGKETAVVADSVGMVLPRLVCMIINEAYFAMQEGVAPGREIDTAMKLGTNYPKGPVEWAGRIGIRQVVAVISALHQSFGEDRYRVAPLLRKTAIGQTAE
jgi:3-hydroxybutyryl-CoA dehydrogenase